MEASRGRTSPEGMTNSCEECAATFPNPSALEHHRDLAHPNASAPQFDRENQTRGDYPEPPSGPEMRADESEMNDQRPSRVASEEGPSDAHDREDSGRDAPDERRLPYRNPENDDRRYGRSRTTKGD